jgi:hypothetical protein
VALGTVLLRGQTGVQRELLLLKLFLPKDFAEEAWLFRIICMALAPVFFGNTFQSYLNVLTTT